MRVPYALVASLGLGLLAFAAPVSAGPLGAVADDCAPSPCAVVNNVCRKAFDVDCVASADPSDDCAGAVCDLINQVCQTAGGANCVGMAASPSAEPAACMGIVCKTINQVCIRVLGNACLG